MTRTIHGNTHLLVLDALRALRAAPVGDVRRRGAQRGAPRRADRHLRNTYPNNRDAELIKVKILFHFRQSRQNSIANIIKLFHYVHLFHFSEATPN